MTIHNAGTARKARTRPSKERALALKLIFESPEDAVFLYVDERTADRFRTALFRPATKEARNKFHCLSTLDGKKVLVNLPKLKVCNFLREPVAQMEKAALEPGDGFKVLVGVAGAPAPFSSRCETGRELWRIFGMVEVGAIEEDPFLHYADADGEGVFINMDHVTFLQAPSRLITEGEEQAVLEEV